jgi:hypothetical protein
MSFKADMESLIVYQPLSIFERTKPVEDDKCHDFVKMKNNASIINTLFKIAAMIPVISLITAAITGYKMIKINEMGNEHFKDGRKGKEELLNALNFEMCCQIYGIGFYPRLLEVVGFVMFGIRPQSIIPTRDINHQMKLISLEA